MILVSTKSPFAHFSILSLVVLSKLVHDHFPIFTWFCTLVWPAGGGIVGGCYDIACILFDTQLDAIELNSMFEHMDEDLNGEVSLQEVSCPVSLFALYRHA